MEGRDKKGRFKKGHHPNSEFKKGHKINFGRIFTKEHREKLSNTHIGQKAWNKDLTKEIDERIKRYGESISMNKERGLKISKKLKGKPKSEEHKKNMRKPKSFIHRKNLSIAGIRKWQGIDYKISQIKAQLGGLMKRPTSYEEKISNLCIENSLPFIYTGNGTFLIGYKNPDFVNKEKRIAIEVYHNYFKIRDFGSCENYEKQRSEYFAKYGYKTIFIREEEIMDKNWEKVCLNKINNFKNKNEN